MPELDRWSKEFVDSLHPSSKILSVGTATVMGHNVPAVLVRNMYGQELVWGLFNTEKGKFKGKRKANSANTEGVRYVSQDGSVLEWTPPFGDYE